ncbi:MAG: ATP12 family protein [Pseudomonadota bacterium]
MTSSTDIKRFYQSVDIVSEEGGYYIALDGKRARATSGACIRCHGEALAEAVADEWRAQEDIIDLNDMPLTALCAAVSSSEDGADAVYTDNIMAYLQSDLVCYRAEAPSALVARQAEEWDGFLTFMDETFSAPLTSTAGVMAVAQPKASIDRVRAALKGRSRELLFVLSTLTEITGSAVIALSLWKRAVTPDAAFDASRLDEGFQEEKWGVDEEAAARTTALETAFRAAVLFLELLPDDARR